jgi:hypothetical protein
LGQIVQGDRKDGAIVELRVKSPDVKDNVGCKGAAVKRRIYACCSYSETVIKSVVRIRLMKTEKTERVLMTCRVWRLAVALYLLVVQSRVYKWSINPFTNPNPVYSHTP